MTTRAVHNFHLPLPEETHALLREEAARAGVPATTLVREALVAWLAERRNQRLYADIQAYARAQAGTELDLDEDLEAAAIEVLAEDPWPNDGEFA
jgi:hypothetical protein